MKQSFSVFDILFYLRKEPLQVSAFDELLGLRLDFDARVKVPVCDCKTKKKMQYVQIELNLLEKKEVDKLL